MIDDPDFKLTKVEPNYDFSSVGGGYFKLYFGSDSKATHKLSFYGLLESKLQVDDNLFEYIKTHHKDKTLSHAIWDLYDLGFPIDQWVQDYVANVKNDVDPKMFNALVSFYRYIKDFGNVSGSI